MTNLNKGIRKDAVCLGLLFVMVLLLLGSNLGKFGLLDPDEPFYCLTAKEMLANSDPWTPRIFGQPQFEKPIFFYWVLYACFHFFGITEFAARLGPCLAGMLVVFLVYLWGRILFKRPEPAFAAASILASSGQFVVLSRVVLTDIFLCLFVTAALASFTWGYLKARRRALAWHLVFVFLGLGFLTKGPLGFFVPLSGIVAYALFNREEWVLKSFPWKGGLAIFSIIGFPWYFMMAKMHGVDFLAHFFIHENVRRFFMAEHRGMDKGYFYPLVMVFGFFPWSSFVAAAFWRAFSPGQNKIGRFLASLFIPSFCFFMLAKSKLMSYIFPLYPIAALMAGAWGWRFFRALKMGWRTKPLFFWSTAFTWVAAPVILIVTGWHFAANYELPLSSPIYAITWTLVPLSWISFFLFMKRKIFYSFCMTVGSMVIFSVLSFGWLLPNAALAFSSKGWASDYSHLAVKEPDGLFLGSKMFVRGMAYYTGATNMGVFSDQPKGGFYTPHPIPVFSGAEDFSKLHQNKFPIYFLIRKKELLHLKEGLEPGYSVSVLEKTPLRVLVRLDRV